VSGLPQAPSGLVMVLSRWSNLFIFSLLALCSAELLRTEVPRLHNTMAVQLHSDGQSTVLDHPNFTRMVYYGLCYSHEDCRHSDMCDLDGSSGCGNRCLSPPDSQGHRRCMMKVVSDPCTHDHECASGRCDIDNWYGCKNMCLSEQDETGHHCNTKPMGEPCDNDKQCLSGVCDSNSTWGCRGLCVSELDERGFNRHCDHKKIAETCAHDMNCEGGTVCDVHGAIEELGRCKGRCITESVNGCKRQHCSPHCPVCLSNLTSRPRGSGINKWTGYPAHRVERNDTSLGSAWHVSLKENEPTELRLRLPSSCIEDEHCVHVKGNLEVSKLNGAKLYVQSGLYTGFPGQKPQVDALVKGTCPLRSDGYPEAGDTDCCYAPEHVGDCTSSPYSKGCEQFLAGRLLYDTDEAWGYQNRAADDSDSFDQSTNQNQFPHGDFALFKDVQKEFNIEVDFSAERYKYFQFGGKSWYMNEPLLKFSRDRNCNHIDEWPEASFEFSLRLEPPEGSDATFDAEVKLTHLEVNRKRSCRVKR